MIKQRKNNGFEFKVCKSVHHHSFQINQPTRCNNFSSLLIDVYSYVQLNMFRAFSRPSSGLNKCSSSLWFYRWIVVIAVLLVVVGPGPRYCDVTQTRLSCNCILILK